MRPSTAERINTSKVDDSYPPSNEYMIVKHSYQWRAFTPTSDPSQLSKEWDETRDGGEGDQLLRKLKSTRPVFPFPRNTLRSVIITRQSKGFHWLEHFSEPATFWMHVRSLPRWQHSPRPLHSSDVALMARFPEFLVLAPRPFRACLSKGARVQGCSALSRIRG